MHVSPQNVDYIKANYVIFDIQRIKEITIPNINILNKKIVWNAHIRSPK